ncbi:MAG: cupin domain-containing protein [Promethearchaeota archaeon]|nr:MAG: cupin domain-containing protein [Candidatus Lokiarchaeota archaeon]
MKIVNVKDINIKETPHNVAVRPLFSFEHASFVHITLQPGETLKKHITPVDATFFGLEGTGKVEIGDEIQDIQKDVLVFSPKGIAHRLFNESDTPFKFMVIKTPTPVNQKTKIL